MSPDSTLPRLAYLGEVPVLNISAGPAILYRLLEDYPKDKLLIAVPSHNPPNPEFEMPNVPHERYFLYNERLTRTRYSQLYARWTYSRLSARAKVIAQRIQPFRPEAILSVAHGLGQFVAARVAERMKLPLHLIVHDNWSSFLSLPPALMPKAEAEFTSVYRAARSRMPVTPTMEALYLERYGAHGTVVYPCRSMHASELALPPLKPVNPERFVVAFAGSANRGMRKAIIALAHAIAPINGWVRIYRRDELAVYKAEGLTTQNVEEAGFLPTTQELHRDLIAQADALFLPMSFEEAERENVELCFPSKLVDYTVSGVPIITCSPSYGSAAAWARLSPGACLVCEDFEEHTLRSAVLSLIHDGGLRTRLAWSALTVGKKMFAHQAVSTIFRASLQPDP